MLKKLRRVYAVELILFFLVGLISAQALAQSYQLSGNYFIRSSIDFLSSTNKVGVLQKGSTFRVINRFPKSNGAEALEIEITAMSRGSHVNPSPTRKLYIYKPAKNSGFISRSIITNEEAGVAQCENCDSNTTKKAVSALMPVSDQITAMANLASQENFDTDRSAFKGPLDDKIQNYSNSTQAARMAEWAMKNKNTSSKGLCYRRVKEAMATQCGPPRKGHTCRNPFAPQGGKKGPGNNLTASVSTEMADAYALSAKTRLKEQGFINLMEIEPYKSQIRSPSDSPKNAILVYSSGIPCGQFKDCGHVEIKLGNPGEPGFVSDYYSKDAVNETPRAKKYGSTYKLVGVMIKPMDKP